MLLKKGVRKLSFNSLRWTLFKLSFFYKQLGSGPSLQSCLYLQDFQGFVFYGCIVVWPNKLILSILQLSYCIPSVKDQCSFSEIRGLAICLNIKVFYWVNRKQLNILKTFLKCHIIMSYYIIACWRWFSPKSGLTNNVPSAICS